MRRKFPTMLSLLIVPWIAGALSTAAATDHVLLIGGLGGEAKYSSEFVSSLTRIRSLLVQRHGYDEKHIRLLAETAETTGGVHAASTLKNIEAEFKRLAGTAKTTDSLLVVCIGHGHSDYVEPKFNLPGVDLTAARLGQLLDSVPALDQRLILSFACSGHFGEFIARPQRAILSSCDGPREIYHTILSRVLIRALESDLADRDKDGTVTFYEMFRALADDVGDHFDSGGLIQTEHPALEDNGDGDLTTTEEGMDAGDGELSRRLRFLPAPGAKRKSPAPVPGPAPTEGSRTKAPVTAKLPA